MAGGNKSGLSEGDLQLIEVVKRHKPSTTYAELADILLEVGEYSTRRHIQNSA